jgi:hypothetical protein
MKDALKATKTLLQWQKETEHSEITSDSRFENQTNNLYRSRCGEVASPPCRPFGLRFNLIAGFYNYEQAIAAHSLTP